MDQQPVISLRNVTKVYEIGQTRLKALNDVSLDVYPGEFALIVGRSGSGKSTLLNMLAGLEHPTRGQILVAGKRIERLSENKLVSFRLKNIGFVFQSFNLFPSQTALENVAVPLMYRGIAPARRMRMAREMLKSVGLLSHAGHTPAQMSGGQQQRVGIARALVTSPRILFADEPTGNLDYNTSREILALIHRSCKARGTTLIMVTHDGEIAKYADRVITLLDGHVTEDRVNPAPEPLPEARHDNDTQSENDFES